jgi:hypothetical protein
LHCLHKSTHGSFSANSANHSIIRPNPVGLHCLHKSTLVGIPHGVYPRGYFYANRANEAVAVSMYFSWQTWGFNASPSSPVFLALGYLFTPCLILQ